MKTQYKIIGIFLIGILLGIVTTYHVIGSNGNTFIISKGIYPSGANYTIWKEGTTIYAKSQYGSLDYYGENLKPIWDNIIAYGLPYVNVELCKDQSLISAPTGWIAFNEGNFTTDERLTVPLGSRLKITAKGCSLQAVDVGKAGGTQIYSSDSTGVFVAGNSGTLINGSSITTQGSWLIIEDIEFVQGVQQNTTTDSAVWLNGMSNGALENVMVTSYKGLDYQLQGIGIKFETVDGLGDQVTWKNVQVSGFTTQIQLAPDHMTSYSLTVSGGINGIKMAHMARASFYDTHFFALHTCIDVTSGASNQIVKFDTVYTESVGYGAINWKDNNYGRKIIIDRLFIADPQANFWTFSNSCKWEFHNVIGSFTNLTTPSLTQNNFILNPNPAKIQIAIDKVDNDFTITLAYSPTIDDTLLGTFNDEAILILDVGEWIKINWSSGTSPTWVWRYYDV